MSGGRRLPRTAPDPTSRIFVAVHRSLVGSAIVRRLQAGGHTQLLLRTHAELDLTNERATRGFLDAERPEFVFLAAAKVGGIVFDAGKPDGTPPELLMVTRLRSAGWQARTSLEAGLRKACADLFATHS